MKIPVRPPFDLGNQIRRPPAVRRWSLWLGMIGWVGAMMALDQGIKWWVRRSVAMGASYHVWPFLSWTPTWNHGVSFGIGGQASGWMRLGLYASIAFFLMILGAMYARSQRLQERAGLGLMLAGALSNSVDRLWFGAVFDFIHVSWGAWDFPVLNVADMLISIGFLALFSGHLTWIGLKTFSKKH